jgi:hypothetical protein
MVTVCLVFWRTARLFSKVAAPLSFPTGAQKRGQSYYFLATTTVKKAGHIKVNPLILELSNMPSVITIFPEIICSTVQA